MTINGSIPGPTLFADWGDEVVVHVTNSLTNNNGSSIHFHGIRQNYTNQNDGVVSVTQCPQAPGTTLTYRWRATEYGSSWYHSHFALQAWEGIFGGMVIRGPSTANWDHDLGNVILQDWSHQTADELYDLAQVQGIVPMDTGLINGTNVFGANSSQTGSYFSTTFTPGESYLLRLVNVAIDTQFKFMIDNHTMTVIASDFVPIVPYQTDIINIGMGKFIYSFSNLASARPSFQNTQLIFSSLGQRYDVVVTANQQSVGSDFWMRAFPQIACSASLNIEGIKGIVHYGSSTGTPTTQPYAYDDGCVDEPLASLVPFLPKGVDAPQWNEQETVIAAPNTDNNFRWYLNGTSFLMQWENPVRFFIPSSVNFTNFLLQSLLQVQNNVSAQSFTNTSNLIDLPNANEWIYLLIETAIPVTHPIHLHGHDFSLLAQGATAYDPSTVVLNTVNPPRRDVALLQGGGYLIIGFKTDNPGVWLMHW